MWGHPGTDIRLSGSLIQIVMIGPYDLSTQKTLVFLREFDSSMSPYSDQNLLTDESREECLIASLGFHSFDCEL